MAFVVFNLLAAAALIGIDQAIKLWATNVLQPVGAMPLLRSLMRTTVSLVPKCRVFRALYTRKRAM